MSRGATSSRWPDFIDSMKPKPYLIDYERLNLGLGIVGSIRVTSPNETFQTPFPLHWENSMV